MSFVETLGGAFDVQAAPAVEAVLAGDYSIGPNLTQLTLGGVYEIAPGAEFFARLGGSYAIADVPLTGPVIGGDFITLGYRGGGGGARGGRRRPSQRDT